MSMGETNAKCAESALIKLRHPAGFLISLAIEWPANYGQHLGWLDPNGYIYIYIYRQWARPSLRVFILKELNAAQCEGLASLTTGFHHLLVSYRLYVITATIRTDS